MINIISIPGRPGEWGGIPAQGESARARRRHGKVYEKQNQRQQNTAPATGEVSQKPPKDRRGCLPKWLRRKPGQ